jgi:hypothetical protein
MGPDERPIDDASQSGETAGHMISGERIRISFGRDDAEFVDIEPGDFLFVPAYTVISR